MSQVCRGLAALGMAWAVLAGARNDNPAQAQIFAHSRPELSSSVHLDEVDGAARAHLERVKAFLADEQWDEAVETLRQIMENYGGKVIGLTDRAYVNVADYCQIQIASLPAPALELYRRRVDALAEKWYQQGLAERDPVRLSLVVNQLFSSSWGDDALWTLGEIALERGDFGAARGYWERLIERPPESIPAKQFEAALATLPAESRQLATHWYLPFDTSDPPAVPVYRIRHDEDLSDELAAALVNLWRGVRLPSTRLAYPETNLDLADIRARLVLVSLLEGSLDRAGRELEGFRRLHPRAQGKLEGREANYAEALTALLESARKWPEPAASGDWPTFAGSPTRTRIAAPLADIGGEVWPAISLGEAIAADGANSKAYSARRPAEESHALLGYHPIVVGNLILVSSRNSIFAFDAKTGKPAWSGDPHKAAGEIFSDEAAPPLASRPSRIGVPRFTLTAFGKRLYARMGSQVTNRPPESFENHKGYLVCLDLTAQGRLMWKVAPDDDRWSFEGAPVSDGENVYVAMRKSDVRPQAHVACYDAETARLRWRVLVCAAESQGGGQFEEMTHNLLTLDHSMLYVNTNLGAVAAVSARDGQIKWARLYTRAKAAGYQAQSVSHFYRDLTPCIYYRGVLIVAPSDCALPFALDASSGQFLWQAREGENAIHLLGVGGENVIASGDHVYWLNLYTGKKVLSWPSSTPWGYGRGILAGDHVLWPTNESLYVLKQSPKENDVLVREPIRWDLNRGAMGGNLVIADGLLLVATADKLYGFERRAGAGHAAAPRRGAKQRSASPAASKPAEPKPPAAAP